AETAASSSWCASAPLPKLGASPGRERCSMASSASSAIRVAASMAALAICACSAGKALAAAPNDAAAARDQQAEFVQAMKPARAGRPVIVVLALNDATETTDLLLPHAVLTRADVADVIVVAPRAGTVRLYPTLQVQAEMDF